MEPGRGIIPSYNKVVKRSARNGEWFKMRAFTTGIKWQKNPGEPWKVGMRKKVRSWKLLKYIPVAEKRR